MVQQKEMIISSAHGIRTIGIAGATSKTGKTTLICRLIPHFPDWAVCKVTTCIPHPGSSCPRGQADTCGICNTLSVPALVIDDPALISQPGTDTGKYIAAGARSVIWIQSTPEALPSALSSILQRFTDEGFPGVIFEGNHVLAHLKVDYSLMMAGSGSRFKRSARDIRDRMDMIVSDWDFNAAVNVVCKHFRIAP